MSPRWPRRRGRVTRVTRLRRRGRWKLPLIAGLVVILVGALIWLVGFSSVLAVRQVRVAGLSLLDEKQVTEVAQVPMGQPLARIDGGAIEDRVKQLPPVREVDVSRSWPGTVRITVVERTTRFIASDGEELTAVDETGVGFTTVAKAPDDAIVAEKVPPEEWPDVASVVGALPAEVRERAERITTRGPDAIVIHLSDDVTVEWGSAEDSQTKAEVLTALMTGVPDASTYNVSAPHHPTTT